MDDASFGPLDRLRGIPRYESVLLLLVGTGGFVIVFDVLRKTVFLGAAWNYDYPAWNFVYDGPVMALLALSMIVVAVGYRRLVVLNERQFLLTLYGLTLLFIVLSFFALPEKSFRRALTPQSGLYYAATVFVDRGPIEFFSSYHSLGTLVGTGMDTRTLAGSPAPEGRYAKEFAAFLASTGLPFSGELAAYSAEIKVQKHGPLAAVAVAPFLLLLGETPAAAAFGSYAVASIVSLVAYGTFRVYFPDRLSRVGSLFVLFTPTYVINMRSGPVAYDAIAAAYIAISVYAFVRWSQEDRLWLLALSGVFFSLGALTKLSVLPLLFGYFVAFFAVSDTPTEVFQRTVKFGVAALVVPLSLLLLGYNFLIQYAFTLFKMLATAEGKVEYINPFVSQLAAIYNARWFGTPVLLFVGVLLIYTAYRRRDVREHPRYALGAALVVSLLPYAALTGMTISRHMLPLITGIGFIGLGGLDVLEDWIPLDQRRFERIVQVSLLVTAGIALVNL